MNPTLDAVCLEIRRHLPLKGMLAPVNWYLKAHPRGKGVHVRLYEWRSKTVGKVEGPFSTFSFYVRSADDVENKLRERALV